MLRKTDTPTFSPNIWRRLSPSEEVSLRAAARKQYKAGQFVNCGWHPVYLHEVYLINCEAGILKG